MTADTRNNERKTGPGNPPVEHRFKPGNPGRPKGSRNKLGEDFIQALAAALRICACAGRGNPTLCRWPGGYERGYGHRQEQHIGRLPWMLWCAKSPQFSSVPPNHLLLGNLRTRANPLLLELPTGSHGLWSKQRACWVSASADVVTPMAVAPSPSGKGQGRACREIFRPCLWSGERAPGQGPGAFPPQRSVLHLLLRRRGTGALPTASGDRPWIDLGLLQHIGRLPRHPMMPTRRVPSRRTN
jgi:hypothetical protein